MASSCETYVLHPGKSACSGKCRGGTCSAPRIWVVAGCEGMVSLFERDERNGVRQKTPDQPVFASLDQFQQSMTQAGSRNAFDQLVLVGSGGDIAWMHSSLPEDAAKRVVAEIKYPLLSDWFREPVPMPRLTEALQRLTR